jgi:tetratricopeptide (TPR) repeat protein
LLAAGSVPFASESVLAEEVVQALPDPAALRLSEALRALGQNPRSVDALVAASQASLALDDVDAASGFIQRAEAIATADGRVKAGRAALMVHRQQPVEALQLFAEAAQAGALSVGDTGERGLAYDLIGDNARAQQDYAVALSVGANPVISRRLALSQAIAGDQRASEATLLPLLQHQDLAAYRTRAFALAILGKADEAVSIAETMLPARLSSRMGPYLRYMPRLTRSQQAAAANLGVFPQAAQIGRDDPALAAYSPQTGAPPPVQTADSRLIPSGEALGSRSGIPRREEIGPPIVRAAVQQPAPQPTPPPSEERVFAQAPVVAVAEPPPAEVAQPSISLADEPGPPPPATRNIAEAFADFSLPAGTAGPAAGAVDISTIQPRREPRAQPAVPARPTPPPKPVAPSRHWVQVATGRDTRALAFDWRRIKREAGSLLARATPSIADWGQTNRLVFGPFASEREANEMVGKLKDKKIDSFRFTSAQGEEVKPLR